jgi:hypothetical protein
LPMPKKPVNLTHVVPFLVEDKLKRIGGLYEKAADWAPFAKLTVES